MPWDQQTIINKLKHSADRFGYDNPHQLKQLSFSLKKIPDQELFNGLIHFFTTPYHNQMNVQELAGYFLHRFNPVATYDLKQILINALPSTSSVWSSFRFTLPATQVGRW